METDRVAVVACDKNSGKSENQCFTQGVSGGKSRLDEVFIDEIPLDASALSALLRLIWTVGCQSRTIPRLAGG
jgi:hypothetical protein